MAIEKTFTTRIVSYTSGGYTIIIVGEDLEQDPVYSCTSLHEAVNYIADLTHRSLQYVEDQQTAPPTTETMPAVLKGTRSAEIIRPKTGFWRKLVGGRAA